MKTFIDIRKGHWNGCLGYPQNTSKEKISPASDAAVIDWSFDAADNYCQNGQEISRHRRATSFTRANERGHTEYAARRLAKWTLDEFFSTFVSKLSLHKSYIKCSPPSPPWQRGFPRHVLTWMRFNIIKRIHVKMPLCLQNWESCCWQRDRIASVSNVVWSNELVYLCR